MDRFPISASTQFPIDIKSTDFRILVKKIVQNVMRLKAIDDQDNLMTAYGRDRHGGITVALIKLKTKIGKGAVEKKIVSIDIKGSSRELLDGIIEEIDEWAERIL